MDIIISKKSDNEIFIHIVASTSAINPDIIGKTVRKSVLLSEESSLVFLFPINKEIDCNMKKYNILLGTDRIITFLK